MSASGSGFSDAVNLVAASGRISSDSVYGNSVSVNVFSGVVNGVSDGWVNLLTGGFGERGERAERLCNDCRLPDNLTPPFPEGEGVRAVWR